jgi:cellulose biosynthesis protein BcsQ
MNSIIYSFYNNKGGVGKTTLCFNSATLYAHNNPETQVLVIDLCPQANISQYLLGGGKAGYENNQRLQTVYKRRNVVGFVDWLLKGNSAFTKPQQSYKVPVCKFNTNIEENLYLIAGDSFLESYSLALNYAVINPANMLAWQEYMTAIRRLCENEFNNKKYDKLTVFIDCNPSFSIYTQMALVSSDYLIVPMMADFSSLEGIKGMFTLLFAKYPSAALKQYAQNIITFHKKVEEYQMKTPVIWEFVFNNWTAMVGVAKAYQAIKDELVDFCYDQCRNYPELFATTNSSSNLSSEAWEKEYFCDVKDFHTPGKVSASLRYSYV